MSWNIYPKEINGHTYYYAQRSWRQKTAPTGSGEGSAKSKVRSETIYLGSAESIISRRKETRGPHRGQA